MVFQKERPNSSISSGFPNFPNFSSLFLIFPQLSSILLNFVFSSSSSSFRQAAKKSRHQSPSGRRNRLNHENKQSQDRSPTNTAFRRQAKTRHPLRDAAHIRRLTPQQQRFQIREGGDRRSLGAKLLRHTPGNGPLCRHRNDAPKTTGMDSMHRRAERPSRS